MNRVQTVTQKYHRVEKQSEKPSRMHKHPAGPAVMPRCALARPGARTPGRIVGRPGCVVPEAPCRIAPPAVVSQRLARAPARLAPHVSQASWPYRGRQPAVSQAILPCRSALHARVFPQRPTPVRPARPAYPTA